jgi:Bacterial SH3 domain
MIPAEWRAVLWSLPLTASLIAGEARADAVTMRDTNLRVAPGTESKILAMIPKGAMLPIGRCASGWCEVFWDGQHGYAVARNFVAVAPPPWAASLAAYSHADAALSRKPKLSAPHEHDEAGAEHSWILELGTAGEWPLNGERPNFGGTIAVEFEPIENWLELEFGLSTLATAGHGDLSADLLFKKPFRLSPTVEFMIGAGPSFSRTLNGPDQGNSWSVEFALDWMFWPTRDVGWFIEPTWSVNPRTGQSSAAVSLGILIGFPK